LIIYNYLFLHIYFNFGVLSGSEKWKYFPTFSPELGLEQSAPFFLPLDGGRREKIEISPLAPSPVTPRRKDGVSG
jgi:hypothetical protein